MMVPYRLIALAWASQVHPSIALLCMHMHAWLSCIYTPAGHACPYVCTPAIILLQRIYFTMGCMVVLLLLLLYILLAPYSSSSPAVGLHMLLHLVDIHTGGANILHAWASCSCNVYLSGTCVINNSVTVLYTIFSCTLCKTCIFWLLCVVCVYTKARSHVWNLINELNLSIVIY